MLIALTLIEEWVKERGLLKRNVFKTHKCLTLQYECFVYKIRSEMSLKIQVPDK